MNWLRRRVDNLQRSYMNKVYMARKIGRDFENILQDSCALSITDHFWINRSDINMTWSNLQDIRDQNKTLVDVALTGKTAYLDWEAAKQGVTSLFATKGAFPKAILGNTMLKLGGTSQYEWVSSTIGKALGLPVQEAVIVNPSVSNQRDDKGDLIVVQLRSENGELLNSENGEPLYGVAINLDDTLVKITLFTSDKISFVHASELFIDPPTPRDEKGPFRKARDEGQHHRYFYDKLPSEEFKRDFERVLILNWLISNHDMHVENYGCLYSPETFEIIGIAPSFDHNSAEFDGLIPELDVPDIVASNIKHHGDVIEKIESGCLDEVLDKEIKNWLSSEQKTCIKNVGTELVNLYQGINRKNPPKKHGGNVVFNVVSAVALFTRPLW